jgi:hypothetical protein
VCGCVLFSGTRTRRKKHSVSLCTILLCGGRRGLFAFERPEPALIHVTAHTKYARPADSSGGTLQASVLCPPNRGALPAMRQFHCGIWRGVLSWFGLCVRLACLRPHQLACAEGGRAVCICMDGRSSMLGFLPFRCLQRQLAFLQGACCNKEVSCTSEIGSPVGFTHTHSIPPSAQGLGCQHACEERAPVKRRVGANAVRLSAPISQTCKHSLSLHCVTKADYAGWLLGPL